MLNHLHIRNYAIVEALELELADGFTCISGETGAGKSILVGALGLLCGDRADSASVRTGADRAELSAHFELAEHSAARQWLQAAELDQEGDCLLRRVIGANGRSRAWINGSPVTLQQLGELGEKLVEIHGQNEHIRLVRQDEQLRLLDAAGDHSAELASTRAAWEAWRTLNQEHLALLEERPLAPGERDLLQFQLEELERDALPARDFEQLEAEHRILARGGELLESLEGVLGLLYDDDAGAARRLHRASERLDRHAALDRGIAEAAALLREAAINCDEARHGVESALSQLDLSPERLAELERRLSLQHDLARKHRVSPDALLEVREALSERLQRAATQEQRLARIDRELAAALETYRSRAEALHHVRAQRAKALSSDVTALMQDLGMQGGVFDIEVRLDIDAAPSSLGADRVELLVSANPGTPPGPLRKVASGGELSRISLALKVASRAPSAATTQVFDEVDAGIGGDTANAVGALLRSLSASGQALCVTHLAQVAAFADQQVRVLKSAGGDATCIEATQLVEQERVDEVARMLSGRLSSQSRAHAEELLASSARKH